MSCGVCGKAAPCASCVDGYIHYLAGDFPCPANPDKDWVGPRNLVELPPLVRREPRAPADQPWPTTADMSRLSSDGLEDLL